jgi:hypothetical protein
MAAPPAPGWRDPPRPRTSLDDVQPRHQHRYVPTQAPRRPVTLVVIAVILLVVVAVIVVVLAGSHPGPSHPSDTISIADAGTSWNLDPGHVQSARFSTSVNGTLYGGFTTTGAPVDVLLMNATEYYNFTNDTNNTMSFNTSGNVVIFDFEWAVQPPGVYFFVVFNMDTVHSTSVHWDTAVQWVS